jgi:hypothetical protein
MDAKEQLIGYVVDWLQTVFGWSDAEVGLKAIHQERGVAKGPRPPLPFLMYAFTFVDLPSGMEEDNIPRPNGFTVTGGRTATLSIVGYGEGSDELLARLGMLTRLAPPAISVENLTAVLDISQFDETFIEARFARDFTVFYRLTIEDPAAPPIPAVGATKILFNGEEYTP